MVIKERFSPGAACATFLFVSFEDSGGGGEQLALRRANFSIPLGLFDPRARAFRYQHDNESSIFAISSIRTQLK